MQITAQRSLPTQSTPTYRHCKSDWQIAQDPRMTLETTHRYPCLSTMLPTGAPTSRAMTGHFVCSKKNTFAPSVLNVS